MIAVKGIAIVGPNASGKSGLAVRLAKQFGGEIISADSRQIYRGFDLCSGKISDEEKDGIPHHLMSFLDVSDSYDAFRFQGDCIQCIEDIADRGKNPIIVGGTGQYVDAVVRGYIFAAVPPNNYLRAHLETLPLDELVDMLNRLQPTAIPFVGVFNRRRLIRALEIVTAGVDYTLTRTQRMENRFLTIGVAWPRDELKQRINNRLRQRIANGMIDEVKFALDCGVPDQRLLSLGLEYREILRYIRGEHKTEADLIEVLALRIGQFAKRQMTWFRRNSDIHWISGSDLTSSQPITLVSRFLSGSDA